MGKLVVSEFVTLDGVFEDPGGAEAVAYGGWAFKFDQGDGQQFKLDELRAADALLLGRVTYEGFARAWPQMEGTGEFGEKSACSTASRRRATSVSATRGRPATRCSSPTSRRATA